MHQHMIRSLLVLAVLTAACGSLKDDRTPADKPMDQAQADCVNSIWSAAAKLQPQATSVGHLYATYAYTRQLCSSADANKVMGCYYAAWMYYDAEKRGVPSADWHENAELVCNRVSLKPSRQ